MTDILHRLHCTIRCDIETAASGCHCAAARDEITRLRAEVERLRSGGCARDQGTTQYCAEAAILAAKVGKLEAECFSLAAWQCKFPDGKTGLVAAEGGDTYCAMAKEVECLRAENERLRAALDGAYNERNRLVAFMARLFPSGLKKTAIEGWDEAWHGCVYIDLPTGQASWHYHDREAHLFDGLPPYSGEWDGHSTDEKYERLARAAIAAQPAPGKEEA